MRDARSGIKVTRDIVNNNLVRDARAMNEQAIIAPESYSMMAVNHARAAIMVLENDTKRNNKEPNLETLKKVQDMMLSRVNEIQNKEYQSNELGVANQKNGVIDQLGKDAKAFNTKLLKVLKDAGIEDAKKQITAAKEFANFNDQHYNVTTLSKIEVVTIAETEVKHQALTTEQKKMFEKIRDLYPLNKKDRLPGENMAWFNNQPAWKKDLIFGAADAILSETKVIPTQLRDSLPLIRNAYTKITSVAIGNGNLKPIVETMHSGTLTTTFPKSTDEELQILTNQNIEQVKQSSLNGKLHLNPLTSPANFINGKVDRADAIYLSRAVQDSKDNNVTKTTTPFNVFRLLPGGGGRDLSGAKQTLAELAKQVANQQVKNYLEGKGNSKAAITAAGEDKTLLTAIDLKKDIDSLGFKSFLPTFRDKNHIHSQISEKLQIITSDPNYNLAKMNVSCASGKDRTGLALEGASIRAVSTKTGFDQKVVAEAMTKAGHTQYMAGSNGGGSIGCHGVKPETVKAANQSMFGEVKDVIGNVTADQNKFKTTKKNIIKQIMDFVNKIPSLISGKKKPEENIAPEVQNLIPKVNESSKTESLNTNASTNAITDAKATKIQSSLSPQGNITSNKNYTVTQVVTKQHSKKHVPYIGK